MKALSFSIFRTFLCLVSVHSYLYAAEAAILEQLQQERATVASTHCNKFRNACVQSEGSRVEASSKRVVCKLKKLRCESLRHSGKHAYYCERCDEQCSLCRQVGQELKCTNVDHTVKMCWNHGSRGIAFCIECRKGCPKGCAEELSLEENNLVSCTICFDEKEEGSPDWVRFDTCDHYDKDEGCYSYNFCNTCVIDQCVNYEPNCPVCRVPIEYSKCDSCKGYLGPDHKKIMYSCTTLTGKVSHNLHTNCFDIYGRFAYKNDKGEPVFHCPLEHGSACCFSPSKFEVAHSAVQQVKPIKDDNETTWLPLEEAERIAINFVSDKPGYKIENACEFCHQVIEDKEESFKFTCSFSATKWHGESHTTHKKCLQKFVDACAIKKQGMIGIYCPLSHQDDKVAQESNARMFVRVDDQLVGLIVPERFKILCTLCNEEIDDLHAANIIPIDCNRRVYGRFFLRYSRDNHRSYYHWRCLHAYTKANKVIVSEGFFLWPSSIKKIPCPYHAGTQKHHLVDVEYEPHDEVLGELLQESENK